ncbi:hypothetical protein [Neobacillus rhizophilus]|uniref:Uncharacterized protein n=1 Tax=Neobacillus rhizophilus TaxID=2833579 RepID=A0A942U956_9BACI|nr:hypothetical protein [Neobacillus rhizophilus]MBS4213129.1 hypothetical protein [Neobacillus rhizophilus]MBU8914748.1 hypothetical protein [Bacillus sp. FJAT-29953]
MTFNEVMALIMPSIIALLFYSKVTLKKVTFFDGLCNTVLFILITNCICYAFLIYLKKTVSFIYTDSFTLKYSIMATFIAIVIAIIYRFLELNFSIGLRVVTSRDEEE